jgi:hypothetical protein
MRQILNSSDLRINRKTYYNLIYNKSLKDKIFNNSFENLILALKEINFRFICLINNELADDGNIKKHILKQLFFFSDQ